MDFSEIAALVAVVAERKADKDLAATKASLARMEGKPNEDLENAAKQALNAWFAAAKQVEVAVDRFLEPYGITRQQFLLAIV